MGKLMFLSMFFLALNLQSQELIQSAEQEEVEKVIERLFEGMRLGDSSIVHSVFSNKVRLYTNYENKDGELIIKEGELQTFLDAVGTPHEDMWDEKIWDTKINVEMGVAQVWTNYAFYTGEKFRHCGINAFHLIKQKGWKIIQLIDTRKNINCEKPK